MSYKKRKTVAVISMIMVVIIVLAIAGARSSLGDIIGYNKRYPSQHGTTRNEGEKGDALHLSPEQVRDAVMSYIRVHHPETAALMQGIRWTGGDITPEGVVGGKTYQYIGDGWNVTISWPIIPKTTHEATAEYVSPAGDLRVFWRGTVDETGTVREKIKGSYQSVESVRDAVMDYIRKNHPDAAVFVKDLAWSGGRTTAPGIIGGETYVYTSGGWTVTISYTVYYDVTYKVTVENEQEGIAWTGTVHEGTVSETRYSHAR